ncbi:acyltransferase family protein [Hansschlegelia zhihuaiae]|uniref:Acyltransferase n=1 Tax=Hansschlegelia zhihuaiae TaxID=405005 RepID=A0A4Q0MCM2_9HYPH|nr:acyltransferase [Hansschlegelia zhihuaiae]RXF70945.1 acyltransferase [Hansschlegelia zhihuaiae]
MSKSRRADIQWLRAMAAASVVLWHSDLIVKHMSDAKMTDNWIYSLLGGFGVELFFMLSGYSICMQVEKVKEARRFLISRAYRVYPLYWLFTGMMLIAFVIHPAWPLSARAEQGALFVLMSFLALPQGLMPLLPLGWTLEMEFIFYVMVAGLIACGGLEKFKGWFGWTLVGLGLAGVAIGSDPIGGWFIFDLINPFMLAFAFGWLLRHKETSSARPLVFAAAAVLSFLALAPWLHEREAGSILRMALSGTVLVGVMRLEPLFETHPTLARPGRIVGDASFSIYLSHWFVLSVLGKLIAQSPFLALPSATLRGIGVLTCIFVGVLVHFLVEARLSRWFTEAPRPMAPRQAPSQ